VQTDYGAALWFDGGGCGVHGKRLREESILKSRTYIS
jgi:hypothetical protein